MHNIISKDIADCTQSKKVRDFDMVSQNYFMHQMCMDLQFVLLQLSVFVFLI